MLGILYIALLYFSLFPGAFEKASFFKPRLVKSNQAVPFGGVFVGFSSFTGYFANMNQTGCIASN